MTSEATPDRGDVVWIDLNPTKGHEQAGRRPVLVLSPARYNALTGLMLACPITTKSKGYVFEVPIPEPAIVRGVILTDQIRSVDWKFRRIELIGRISANVLAAVQRNAVKLLTS